MQGGEDGIARNTGGSLSNIVCFLKDHFKHISLERCTWTSRGK